MPQLDHPGFIVKRVVDSEEGVVQAGFLKTQAEAFLLLDHNYATAQKRWELLQDLTNFVISDGAKQGIECISAWIPPSVESSFGKRLLELGFTKSPWPCYSLLL